MLPFALLANAAALCFFMSANISSVHFIWFDSRDVKPMNPLLSSAPSETPAPAAVPAKQRDAGHDQRNDSVNQRHVFPGFWNSE
jgi:hypothetical protein